MTTRNWTLIAFVACAAATILTANSARANEWWQPPGSTEMSSYTYPDGTTNHWLRMPDGSDRVVTTTPSGAVHRYLNDKVRLSNKPPAKKNPLDIRKPPEQACDRSAGCGGIPGGGG